MTEANGGVLRSVVLFIAAAERSMHKIHFFKNPNNQIKIQLYRQDIFILKYNEESLFLQLHSFLWSLCYVDPSECRKGQGLNFLLGQQNDDY